ncbi:MAG: hypothetical protein JWO89_3687 [Verrucomicrobiaceae bacterium]|nr:hypothetical protein [Verrucomicrobiaceae bacterium]
MQKSAHSRNKVMNLTPEIESMVQHTCQGVLCVLPVVPLLLYVVVYCYTLLAPMIVQLVKWRSQGLSMRRGTGSHLSPVSQASCL